MTYKLPELSTEIFLSEQMVAPSLPPDVVMCAPVSTENTDISVNAIANVSASASVLLSALDEASATYKPPSLSQEITLKAQTTPAQDLSVDVVLCEPISVDDDAVLVVNAIAIASGFASANIEAEAYFTGVSVSATSSISGVANVSMAYDNNVFRGVMTDVSGSFQQSKLQSVSKQSKFEANEHLDAHASMNWQQAKLIGDDNKSTFESNERLVGSDRLLFEDALLIGNSSAHKGEYGYLIGHKKSILSESARLVCRNNWYSFEAMAYRQIERAVQGENSRQLTDKLSTFSDYSKFVVNQNRILIETARLPKNTTGYLPPPLSQVVILQEQIALPSLPLDVVLCAPKDYGRIFTGVRVAATTTINGIAQVDLQVSEGGNTDYGQGVIFVTNSVSLVRSDDGREIKLLGFSVGIDSNSYAWSFSATMPLSELSKVDTAHEQRIGVNFTCNGNLWRFVLDSCDDSVSFGESSLTIKGKSRAMLLAHPYATQRGFKFDTAMSARQIADAELNRNGVPSGFTLDWQLAGVNGWNVPANTYSYTGKTPINSLQWIAEAAGGFINADMSADILHVLAHYPIPSWEWAAQTPSINLPMSLITSRSRGRINKPGYNGVTLYGENDNGIGALIKRTGTSGGYQPPMVTSDLMTDQLAAISRGKMILSDTGDIGNIGISMPLVADIGVLKPSTLIGVNDGEQWVGMVRGTTITGRLSSNRALEIDQSIDVERHFDKEIV